MAKLMDCHVALEDEEKERAIALSSEMGISMSALFRSVLYSKIPKTPKKEVVKTLLKLGEVDDKINEVMIKIPVKDRKEFKELQGLLRELENRLCQ